MSVADYVKGVLKTSNRFVLIMFGIIAFLVTVNTCSTCSNGSQQRISDERSAKRIDSLSRELAQVKYKLNQYYFKTNANIREAMYDNIIYQTGLNNGRITLSQIKASIDGYKNTLYGDSLR